MDQKMSPKWKKDSITLQQGRGPGRQVDLCGTQVTWKELSLGVLPALDPYQLRSATFPARWQEVTTYKLKNIPQGCPAYSLWVKSQKKVPSTPGVSLTHRRQFIDHRDCRQMGEVHTVSLAFAQCPVRRPTCLASHTEQMRVSDALPLVLAQNDIDPFEVTDWKMNDK